MAYCAGSFAKSHACLSPYNHKDQPCASFYISAKRFAPSGRINCAPFSQCLGSHGALDPFCCWGLGKDSRSGNRKQFDSIGENVMFIWSGRAPS